MMVPSELDSFVEGKFLSDNAEKVKMMQTFSKFFYPLYKFQLWWFLLFGCENLSFKLCLSKIGQYIFLIDVLLLFNFARTRHISVYRVKNTCINEINS